MTLPAVDNLEIDVRSPRALELYLELLHEDADWQAAVNAVRRNLHVDQRMHLTPDELRELVGHYIPEDHRLSDVVIALRCTQSSRSTSPIFQSR
jgi:hypothetical protein